MAFHLNKVTYVKVRKTIPVYAKCRGRWFACSLYSWNPNTSCGTQWTVAGGGNSTKTQQMKTCSLRWRPYRLYLPKYGCKRDFHDVYRNCPRRRLEILRDMGLPGRWLDELRHRKDPPQTARRITRGTGTTFTENQTQRTTLHWRRKTAIRVSHISPSHIIYGGGGGLSSFHRTGARTASVWCRRPGVCVAKTPSPVHYGRIISS